MKRSPFLLLLTLLVACGPQGQTAAHQTTSSQAAASTAAPAHAELTVTATTPIIADFVREVGGERVAVNVLVPAGSDPHTFSPSPDSIRMLSGSQALFSNGAGLEGWLGQVTGAAPDVPVYALTDGLPLLDAAEEQGQDEHGNEHSPSEHSSNEYSPSEHSHGDHDPHAWWDADLALRYLEHIVQALSQLDPQGASLYRQNADAYAAQIREADAYAREQFAAIPAEHRRVVTAHDALNYFAQRYGLEVMGAVIPGLSTEREPSAQELAELAKRMKDAGARVILSENPSNDRLAHALAAETGARIAPPILTDTLGPAGSPAASYLGALRQNVDSIVSALKDAYTAP